jgi:hypothetical protein
LAVHAVAEFQGAARGHTQATLGMDAAVSQPYPVKYFVWE